MDTNFEQVTFKCIGRNNSVIEISFDSDGSIQPLLDKFKSFLLAMTYSEGLIDKYLYDCGNGVEEFRNCIKRKVTFSDGKIVVEDVVNEVGNMNKADF